MRAVEGWVKGEEPTSARIFSYLNNSDHSSNKHIRDTSYSTETHIVRRLNVYENKKSRENNP